MVFALVSLLLSFAVLAVALFGAVLLGLFEGLELWDMIGLILISWIVLFSVIYGFIQAFAWLAKNQPERGPAGRPGSHVIDINSRRRR